MTNESAKEKVMSANGTFEVDLTQKEDVESPAGRMLIKKTYLGDMKEQLGSIDTQVEELNAQAGSMGDEAKAKLQGQLEALTGQKEAIAMKMEELQGASGEAWGKAKLELEELMTELATIYENMKKDFSAS